MAETQSLPGVRPQGATQQDTLLEIDGWIHTQVFEGVTEVIFEDDQDAPNSMIYDV